MCRLWCSPCLRHWRRIFSLRFAQLGASVKNVVCLVVALSWLSACDSAAPVPESPDPDPVDPLVGMWAYDSTGYRYYATAQSDQLWIEFFRGRTAATLAGDVSAVLSSAMFTDRDPMYPSLRLCSYDCNSSVNTYPSYELELDGTSAYVSYSLYIHRSFGRVERYGRLVYDVSLSVGGASVTIPAATLLSDEPGTGAIQFGGGTVTFDSVPLRAGVRTRVARTALRTGFGYRYEMQEGGRLLFHDDAFPASPRTTEGTWEATGDSLVLTVPRHGWPPVSRFLYSVQDAGLQLFRRDPQCGAGVGACSSWEQSHGLDPNSLTRLDVESFEAYRRLESPASAARAGAR